MNGLILLTAAAIILGLYAVYDKLVVFDHVQDAFFLTFVSRLMICLLVAPFLLLPVVQIPGFRVAGLAVALGFLYIVSALVYFTGVRQGDPSTMIVFLNAKPAIVVVVAALLLGEVLVPLQYAGIVTIIGATLLLTVSRVDGRIRVRETAKYGALFAAVVAGIDLAAKYLVTGASPLAIYALAGLGQGIAGGIGLLYLWLYSRDRITGNVGLKGLQAIGVRTVLFVTGLTLFYLALVSTPVSIASSIVATQTAFTVLFTWIAARFGMGDIEDLGQVSHMVKLVAAAGIVVGVTLLSQPSLLPF